MSFIDPLQAGGPLANQGDTPVGSSFFSPQAFLALSNPELVAKKAAEAGLDPQQILQLFQTKTGAANAAGVTGSDEGAAQQQARQQFMQALSGLQEVLVPPAQPQAPAVAPQGGPLASFNPQVLSQLLQMRQAPQVQNFGSLIRGV